MVYHVRMKLSAVLLAGGESRRMGRDKATLEFDDQPLWRRQLNLLRHLQPAEILLAARTDPSWRPADVQFVADAPPSRGPISGLAAAFAKMQGTHLLVLAVDMPFMTDQWLRPICHSLAHGRGTIAAIEERLEPLAAVYPKEAHAEIVRALDKEDLSLQSLGRKLLTEGKLRRISVEPQEAHLFQNFNTPADWEKLRVQR